MSESDLPCGWTWNGVVDRLEEYVDLEQSARDYGAIKRLRVIRNARQLLRLTLVYALSGFSLRTTAAWAEQAGEASFSDVALLKRLRNCGPWLAELVSLLHAARYPEGCGSEDSRRLVAVDATTVCSPGGLHKSYRVLHTSYDIGAQRFISTEVTDRRQAERLYAGGVEAGDIRLGDRIYARYPDLSTVQAAGADYVVRLGKKTLKLRSLDGKAFSRAAAAMRAQVEGLQDIRVIIEGEKGDAQLKARIIVLALPPNQAEAARRRAAKNARKWGYTLSEEVRAMAGCLMVVTSLSTDDWDPQRILALYRRRWQVELAFKRLKSLFDLERLRAFDPDLVHAWIHAILIVALLIDLDRPSAQPEAPDSPPSDPENNGPFHSGDTHTSSLKA